MTLHVIEHRAHRSFEIHATLACIYIYICKVISYYMHYFKSHLSYHNYLYNYCSLLLVSFCFYNCTVNTHTTHIFHGTLLQVPLSSCKRRCEVCICFAHLRPKSKGEDSLLGTKCQKEQIIYHQTWTWKTNENHPFYEAPIQNGDFHEFSISMFTKSKWYGPWSKHCHETMAKPMTFDVPAARRARPENAVETTGAGRTPTSPPTCGRARPHPEPLSPSGRSRPQTNTEFAYACSKWSCHVILQYNMLQSYDQLGS